MTVVVNKKVEVTLTLTEEECEYLGRLTQNFLGDGGIEAEDPDDQAIRCGIFTALKEALA